MWQRTEPVWLIRRLSVSAGLTDTSKPGKHKELLTFPTKKKHNLHPSYIFTNFTPHSALTIWAEWSHTQWGREALKKSLYLCFAGNTNRPTRSFISRFLKRKKEGRGWGGGKSAKSALPGVFFFLFSWGSVCAGNPFICLSLAPHSSS